jgi:hypothetical protein
MALCFGCISFVLASFAAFGWLRLLACGCISCCCCYALDSAASALELHRLLLLLLHLLRLHLLLLLRRCCLRCVRLRLAFVVASFAAAIWHYFAASAFVVASFACCFGCIGFCLHRLLLLLLRLIRLRSAFEFASLLLLLLHCFGCICFCCCIRRCCCFYAFDSAGSALTLASFAAFLQLRLLAVVVRCCCCYCVGLFASARFVASAAAAAIAFASAASAFVVAFASAASAFVVASPLPLLWHLLLLHQLCGCVSCCCCYGIGFCRISFGTCISGRIFLRHAKSST